MNFLKPLLLAVFFFISHSAGAVTVNIPSSFFGQENLSINFNSVSVNVGTITRWTSRRPCRWRLKIVWCGVTTHSRNNIHSSATHYRWDFGDGHHVTGVIDTAGNFYHLGNDQLAVNLPEHQHIYTQAGDYIATLTVTNSNGESATLAIPVKVGMDVCNLQHATIHSTRSLGLWNNAISWNLNRIPNQDDIVFIHSGHTIFLPPNSQISVKAICINDNGVVRGFFNNLLDNPNNITITTDYFNNKGTLIGASGINGSIISNQYLHAKAASDINITTDFFLNHEQGRIIGQGQGGNDPLYLYYQSGSGELNGFGGQGGDINITAQLFDNRGLLQSSNGGDAKLFNSWTQFVYGNAYGGKGGDIRIFAQNMARSINNPTAHIQAGCGGLAHGIANWFRHVVVFVGWRGWVFGQSGHLYDVLGGAGGDVSVNLGHQPC